MSRVVVTPNKIKTRMKAGTDHFQDEMKLVIILKIHIVIVNKLQGTNPITRVSFRQN